MLPFRLGAFKAAVEAGRPVVPIHLEGTRCILRPGSRLQRPGHITLSIGEPIIPAAEGWPEMVRLRDMARARLDHPVSAPIHSRRRALSTTWGKTRSRGATISTVCSFRCRAEA